MTAQPATDPTSTSAAPAPAAIDSVRMQTVAGLTFRALSSRSTDSGSAVFVLIHGIGTSHRYMARLHAELSAGAVVHSIDLPGFGGLRKPAGSPDVSQIADALGTVLDELGVRGAVLIGHSMGAQWVVELAVQRPDLARAVVISSPVTDSEHRSLRSQSLLLGVDCLREPPTAGVTVMLDYLRCGPVWYLKQARHMLSFPLEDRVAELASPLLVLRGGDDPIAGQEWCRRLSELAPVGSMSVIPGHRHVVHFTAAAAVAARIRTFLHQASVTDGRHLTD